MKEKEKIQKKLKITQKNQKNIKTNKKIRRGRGKVTETNLEMISANGAGIKNKIFSVKKEIKMAKSAIFMFQETHFKTKGKLKIHDYEIFESIRTK